ncbi:hypothetical protein JVT61DRAFT_12033 [Boletus reticuloceps]|uniref:DUF8190 domain-containing protein n=1 Tax=Boletus reticuloceps TaxID=495285 RepID=A0A8I2YEC9_9AGAM|nr:hypothetical protein JVT61DRAFT_12033 [Boletus reticuloceps]
MQADDPYHQDIDDDAIMRTSTLNRFTTTYSYFLSLATLTNLYHQSRPQEAVRLLQHCSHLIIPNSLLLDPNNNTCVLTAMDGHFVDYSLCLGARLGLNALLPSLTIAHDHTWHIQLSFSRLCKLWPSTPSKLPFSTTGHMIHIGTRQQEETWLALVPNTVLKPPHHLDVLHGNQHHDATAADCDDLRLAEGFTPLVAPTTALLPTHAYMIILFFAHVLSTMRFNDIHLTNPYPEDLSKNSVSRETNLL